MNTLLKRLHWALVGYKAKPWPAPCPEPEPKAPSDAAPEPSVSDDVQSSIPLSSLRGTLKLAADLLAPHFQSAISAEAYSGSSPGIFSSRGIFSKHPPGDLLTRYEAPASTEEEIDIFLSSAAWLAREGFGPTKIEFDGQDPYAHSKRELRRLFEAAFRDIYE